MKRARFHSAARAELREAADYYDSCSPGLGRSFTDEVSRAVARLQEYPQLGAPYESTPYRYFSLPHFPYVLYYQELAEIIRILAVAHGKRRQGYWEERAVGNGETGNHE